MYKHDPYSPILNELLLLNCCDTDERLLERLRLSREVVSSLRKAYAKCPCCVDYSDETIRAAYLLAYYPFYIEIVYTELSKIPKESFPQLWKNENLSICIFGGGPCPEIVGFLAFVNEYYPNIKSAKIYVFDKYAETWSTCLNITCSNVLPSYWKGDLEVRLIPCDLLDCGVINSILAYEAIESSNFFVMQNWLNDQTGSNKIFINHEIIIQNIMGMINTAPDDSLLLFADLDYPRVRILFREIEKVVQTYHVALPVLPVQNNAYEIYPNIQYPPLLDELFIGTDGLIKKIRYYSTVIRKYLF